MQTFFKQTSELQQAFLKTTKFSNRNNFNPIITGSKRIPSRKSSLILHVGQTFRNRIFPRVRHPAQGPGVRRHGAQVPQRGHGRAQAPVESRVPTARRATRSQIADGGEAGRH